MKSWLTFVAMLGLCSAVECAWGAQDSGLETTAAIQAIAQAPDPSAAVAAYANGIAADRNNAAVHEAYVARMVDFGLPEMAYRQARTLTSLVFSNGLAWSVLAYVDARRGDMTNAVADIDLAGQFAPEHPFVQRTAGEVIAWYDLQADRTQLSPNARAGLDRIRSLLQNRPAYMTAYNTARQAYQNPPAPNTSTEPPAAAPPATPQRPSLVETNPPQASVESTVTTPPPTYAYPPPSYYYPQPYPYIVDSGPIWVEPDPVWWWWPVGAFAGTSFVPYNYVFIHDRHHRGRHNHHRHERGWIRDRASQPSWNHLADRGQPVRDGTAWHRDGRGRPTFFGTPAQPNPAVAQNRAGTAPSWTVLQSRRDLNTPVPNQRRQLVIESPRPTPAPPSQSGNASSFDRLNRGGSYKSGQGTVRPPVVAAPSRGPSWSGLGPSRSPAGGNLGISPTPAPSLPAPRAPAPAPPPSWSTLGRGASPGNTSGSGSGHGRPSWSTLER